MWISNFISWWISFSISDLNIARFLNRYLLSAKVDIKFVYSRYLSRYLFQILEIHVCISNLNIHHHNSKRDLPDCHWQCLQHCRTCKEPRRFQVKLIIWVTESLSHWVTDWVPDCQRPGPPMIVLHPSLNLFAVAARGPGPARSRRRVMPGCAVAGLDVQLQICLVKHKLHIRHPSRLLLVHPATSLTWIRSMRATCCKAYAWLVIV